MKYGTPNSQKHPKQSKAEDMDLEENFMYQSKRAHPTAQ
jgi:hypothetical protein